jgi:DNA-directed RNA polymerase subunit RPC12/RpoP
MFMGIINSFYIGEQTMPQKTLGYTELEWVCKRCQTKNPGLSKTCSNCGAPMAADDQFELPDQQKIITDEAVIQSAQKGADFHCPYCGARNAAGSETCNQCGGDLKDAQARQAGQVLGAFTDQPAPEITCPFCSEKVKAGLERCPNCGGDLVHPKEKTIEKNPSRVKMPVWLMILLGVVVLACIGSAIYLLSKRARTNELSVEVKDVNWQRIVLIQQLQPVSKGDWEENLPEEAENVECEDRYRETSSEPAPKSTEVCGTPYTLDEGSGVGKVVQDCEYEVYDSYCEYTVDEWKQVNQVEEAGNDLLPAWPEFDLAQGQREGERQEIFLVVFAVGDQLYKYRPANLQEFEQFQPGSDWTITVNGFGAVTDVVVDNEP